MDEGPRTRVVEHIFEFRWSQCGIDRHQDDTRECRVMPIGDEPVGDGNRTRAWVNEATRIVLANGLGLLGVTAPERL